MRKEVWKDGVLVDFEDNRTVSAMLELKLEELRMACTQSILSVVPLHDQMNAALGILDDKEAERVADLIRLRRNHFKKLKAAVYSIADTANSDKDLGACDAIGKVVWNVG
jgi:hypothetical protein